MAGADICIVPSSVAETGNSVQAWKAAHIRASLASIVEGFFKSINDRNFDATSKFYKDHFAPGYAFTGPIGCKYYRGAITLDGQLDDWRQRAKANSGFEVRILHVETEITKKLDDVMTYVNHQQVNCPPGLVKNTFSVFKWSFLDGRWMVLEMRSMTGAVVEEGF